MLLKPRYDVPLSNITFEFDLRRYTEARGWCRAAAAEVEAGAYTRSLFSST